MLDKEGQQSGFLVAAQRFEAGLNQGLGWIDGMARLVVGVR